MIDVKIMKKPKNGGGGSTSSTSGFANIGTIANEAKHAAKADKAVFAEQADYAARSGSATYADYAAKASDLSEDSPIREQFLSRLYNDIAKGHISFEQGLTSFPLAILREGTQFGAEFEPATDNAGSGKGVKIDGEGYGELLSLIIRKALHSPNFRNGMTGEGWRLAMEDGLSKLELDELTVRKAMHVFELVIERIRSVGGQIVVSAANGKVKSVETTFIASSSKGVELIPAYKIYFEGDNYFLPHDFMRCQTFTGDDIRGYWVEVEEIGADYVIVPISRFDGTVPQAGDEVVLMGNSTNGNRQNFITISATEDGQPRVDVYNGVNEKHFSGCLRARLGNLDGIEDAHFPANDQPHGDGLYADNAYLKGTFVLAATGKDIAAMFKASEEGILSAVTGVRYDMREADSFLDNAAFKRDLESWETGGITYFTTQGKWLWIDAPLAWATHSGEEAAYISNDTVEWRKSLFLCNSYVMQRRANYRRVPTYYAPSGIALKRPQPVRLVFLYKSSTGGRLTVGFEGLDKQGFESFDAFSYDGTLAPSDDFVMFEHEGLWNGTGNFVLTFSGEIYISTIMLGSDTGDVIAYRYSSLFQQSDKLVKIAAMSFNDNGELKYKSELALQSDLAALTSRFFDEDGNPKATSGFVTGTNFDDYKSGVSSVLDEIVGKFGNYVSIEAFSGLFAAAVQADANIVKQAQVSAFVTKDENGRLQSGVIISGDQIDMAGKVNINGNFIIDEAGKLHAVDGEFSGKIIATSGTIGGFIIANGHIGGANVEYDEDGNITVSEQNKGLFLYNEMIGFNADGRQAIIGTWNNLGQPMLCRLVDTAMDGELDYALQPKCGIVFDIENSIRGNYAFAGKGAGVLNGIMEGYSYQKISLDKKDTVFSGYMDLYKANRFVVKSSQETCILALPKISHVREALSIGNTTPFCVRLTVIADINTVDFYVSGRYGKQSDDGAYPWDNEEYPVITSWENSLTDTYHLAGGDSMEVLLIYDPGNTETLNKWPLKYTARFINRLL